MLSLPVYFVAASIPTGFYNIMFRQKHFVCICEVGMIINQICIEVFDIGLAAAHIHNITSLSLSYSQTIGLTQSDTQQPVSPSQSNGNQSSSPVGSAHVPPTVAPRTAPKPRKVSDLLISVRKVLCRELCT